MGSGRAAFKLAVVVFLAFPLTHIQLPSCPSSQFLDSGCVHFCHLAHQGVNGRQAFHHCLCIIFLLLTIFRRRRRILLGHPLAVALPPVGNGHLSSLKSAATSKHFPFLSILLDCDQIMQLSFNWMQSENSPISDRIFFQRTDQNFG